MIVLGFLFFSALAGCLLYLPFFLWFRFRKPRTGRVSATLNYTPAGYLLIAVQVLAMFAGLFVRDTDPGSRLGTLIHGDGGVLKWWACILIVFTVVGALLRFAGVALERPAATDAPAPAAAPAKRASGFRVATVGGVAVIVHASYLFGGLLIAVIANAGLEAGAGYCVAYAALFALHESGHAVVARGLGIKVFSIDLSGIGGLCRLQVPRSVRHTLLVYSAGLAAQCLLLLLTLAAVAVFGAPESPFGAAVVVTFTWVNALVFLINLVPGTTYHGGRTDGAMLWQLYRHAFHGAAHPLAAQYAASPLFDPSTRLATITGLVPEGFATGIEILNDDTTPMEFVVEMLERHAGLGREAAIAAMLGIHQRGGLLLPLPDRGSAEAAADAIARDVQAQGHRLVCRAVVPDA